MAEDPTQLPPPPESQYEVSTPQRRKSGWLAPTVMIGTPMATLFLIICFILFLVALWWRFLSRGEFLRNIFPGNTSGVTVDCSGATSVKIPQEYMPWIKDAADKWLNGDQAALIALIQIESGWQSDARNSSEHIGFGQFSRGTAGDYNEFTGGNDGKGTVWEPGKVDGSSQDARYDPKRSIYGTAHKLHNDLGRFHNDLREAYERGYHTYSDAEQERAAKDAGGKLMKVYDELKVSGGCKEAGGSSGSGGGVAGGSGVGPQGGKVLYVPGVKQATSGDCGQASVLMIARYYNPNFRDPKYYNAEKNQTMDNSGCVSDLYLDQKTPYNDWVRYSETSWEPAKRSIAGGDPVVLYTAPGAIFHEHIVVIAGYDPADKTFYINNPNVGSCECWPDNGPTKTPNGKKATEAWLSKYWGIYFTGNEKNSGYHTNYIVRKKYL